jgi:integrase
MKSHQVRFWDVRPRKTASGWSYTVRWTVGSREKSRTLARKAQAERFRSQLMQAADRGEAFDDATGLPDSMTRQSSTVTWYQYARSFVDARWPKVAAKGRISLVEGLMAVTPVLVTTTRGAPDPEVLREAMRKWAFNPNRRDTAKPVEIEAALAWLAKASVPITALQEASLVSKALDACSRKLDGTSAAPEYYRRRRRIFYSALKCAVRENHLAVNPLAATDDSEWQAPEVNGAVDRRRVANPAHMEKLLQAIRETGKTQGPRLVALYGCMYYGGLRPSEAASLLRDECRLPSDGWGLLEFSEIRSAAGREWTDDGDTHETRGPKGGPRNAIRRVPIPPVLVKMLREHIDQFGTADDGRLFRTYRGGIFLPSTLWQVLQKARPKAFSPAQVASPLARKPYDFRHAGISWRLNAGTPATLVAEWAGHTVEVLYRIYAHCLEGDDERWFARMEEALATPRAVTG